MFFEIQNWAEERPFNGDPIMVADIIDASTEECVDIIYHNIQTDEVWTKSGKPFKSYDPDLKELHLGLQILEILTSKMFEVSDDEGLVSQVIGIGDFSDIANEIIELISKQ